MGCDSRCSGRGRQASGRTHARGEMAVGSFFLSGPLSVQRIALKCVVFEIMLDSVKYNWDKLNGQSPCPEGQGRAPEGNVKKNIGGETPKGKCNSLGHESLGGRGIRKNKHARTHKGHAAIIAFFLHLVSSSLLQLDRM